MNDLLPAFSPLLLKTLLDEFQGKLTDMADSVPRQIKLPDLPNKIKVAIGMRRTGKTWFLLQKFQKLISEDASLLSRILYVNFEDDRLLPLSASTLGNLLDTFYTLYPENHHQLCYFVLDEIQNIPQWEITVRRFFDSKKTDIFLTGSSAKLLSKEIATSLRGRSITTEIWPYSFNEYLLANGITLPAKPFGKISQDKLLQFLKKYIEEGGFPETTGIDLMDRNRILQEYVDVVIFRDIIERHNITNIQLVKYLIKTLIRQAGSPFSVNKFYNDSKSQGMTIGKMTIHDYLSYIEDAYLVLTVPLFSESMRKTQSNPKKIYAIDTGLINAYTVSTSENTGHLFENIVYLELRRRQYEIYYYLTHERYEVDFLAKSPENQFFLYQVVWEDSDSSTMERETRALKSAEKELKELNVQSKIITPKTFLEWVIE